MIEIEKKDFETVVDEIVTAKDLRLIIEKSLKNHHHYRSIILDISKGTKSRNFRVIKEIAKNRKISERFIVDQARSVISFFNQGAEEDLDDLIGCPTNGAWTLNVQDNNNSVNTTGGILLDWSITFLNTCVSITFSWSPGNTLSDSMILNPVATPDSATEYVLTVTDNSGCGSASDTVLVGIFSGLGLSMTTSNVSCSGASDGAATVSMSGIPPFTYLWDDPLAQTTATASGLDTGTYSVIVITSDSCYSSTSVTITEPPGALTAGITDSVNVICKDGNNGQATVTASGGTLPYTYLWNDPLSQTTAIASGLLADTFTVAVTDSNGCNIITNVIITEPSLLGATISASTNVNCNGANDGDATVFASGGTQPSVDMIICFKVDSKRKSSSNKDIILK